MTMRTYIPDGYEISKHRYMELLNYCRQYDELKQKLANCYGVGSPILTDLPKGGAKTSIVERQALNAQKYSEKIDKIEGAARKATDGVDVMYYAILRNVTRGITYEHLDVPYGRRQFYTIRRLFFWLLDKEV